MDCLSLDSALGMSPLSDHFPPLASVCQPTKESETSQSLLAELLDTTDTESPGSTFPSLTDSSTAYFPSGDGKDVGPLAVEDDVSEEISAGFVPEIALPRVLQRPEIVMLSKQLGPESRRRHQGSHKKIEALHYAVDRKDDAAVFSILQDVDDPVDCNALRHGSLLTPLQRALTVGSVPSAIYLVMAGASLDTVNRSGETPLIQAVRKSFPDDFVALLCELNADVDATDDTGRCALHYAAELGPAGNTILALAGYGANLNLPDCMGNTPLLAAVSRSRLTSTRLLVRYGADLEATTTSGKTVLGMAITQRSAAIAGLLCEGGAQVNRNSREGTPLLVAITLGCIDIAEMLLQAGADPNIGGLQGSAPLFMAAALGHQDLVQMLVAKGAKVKKRSRNGMTALQMAAQNGHVEIVQFLIDAGASLNTDGVTQTPFELAIEAGHLAVVRVLLGLEPDSEREAIPRGKLLVHSLECIEASQEDAQNLTARIDIARALIENGADITASGRSGLSPLHHVAQLGLDELVNVLIAKGVPVNSTTWSGHTPLFSAAQGGHLSTTRLLLEKHGADLDARTHAGDNLLTAAASQPAVLRWLLGLRTGGRAGLGGLGSRARLDVNGRNECGATALHYAAMRGCAEGVQLLLRKGAGQFLAHAVYDSLEDLRNGTNYRQGTPAGLARQRGHAKIAGLLEGWKYR